VFVSLGEKANHRRFLCINFLAKDSHESGLVEKAVI
jgi:hypothetical protein